MNMVEKYQNDFLIFFLAAEYLFSLGIAKVDLKSLELSIKYNHKALEFFNQNTNRNIKKNDIYYKIIISYEYLGKYQEALDFI